MRTSLLLLSLLLAACTPRGAGGGGGDDDDSATDDDDATGDDDDAAGPPQVLLTTTLGDIHVELSDDAPVTAANFLQYVDDGFFDGDDGEGATIFHRVIVDFMNQGGGMLASGAQKTTRDPIVNEAFDSGLSNVRGTLSMARTNDPDSATSQFFINAVDNVFLDPGGSTPDGYAVFGVVTDGMDVVDAINVVPTGGNDRPLTDVVIEDAERL